MIPDSSSNQLFLVNKVNLFTLQLIHKYSIDRPNDSFYDFY